MARRTGQVVPPSVLAVLRKAEYAETRREMVVVVLPHDDEHVLEGRILSSVSQVNFLRRFGYADNALGRALLGSLLNEPYVELRVRAAADAVSGICVELECFAPKKEWERLRLHDGCSVAVVVRPAKLRDERKIWVARRVERLDSRER
jgi:hypothetical protein